MKAIANRGQPTEASVVKYIIRGLVDRELAALLSVQQLTTVRELLPRIKTYESTMRRRDPPVRGNQQPKDRKDRKLSTEKRPREDRRQCFNCDQKGHVGRECIAPVKCYKCICCTFAATFPGCSAIF